MHPLLCVMSYREWCVGYCEGYTFTEPHNLAFFSTQLIFFLIFSVCWNYVNLCKDFHNWVLVYDFSVQLLFALDSVTDSLKKIIPNISSRTVNLFSVYWDEWYNYISVAVISLLPGKILPGTLYPPSWIWTGSFLNLLNEQLQLRIPSR